MNDYFYGNEHEQYLHVQVPMALIKEPMYKSLSGDAKLLYGLLLNRAFLSIRNGWRDEQNKVYIIYTIEEMMEDINCSEKKAIKLTKELKDVDLIETVRRGLNKPNLIYVKNFTTNLKYQKQTTNPLNTGNCNFDSSGNGKNYSSGTIKKTVPEQQKLQASNNDLKKIYDIDNKSDMSSQSAKSYPQTKNDMTRLDLTDDTSQPTFSEIKKELPQTHAYQANGLQNPSINAQPNLDQYTTYGEWESRVKKNIGYNYFIQEREPYIKLIDTIVHNIITILIEPGEFITLNKKENKKIRTIDAKEICLQLKYDHIRFVLEKFQNVTNPVTNKGNYLKSIILSSLEEIAAYYQNEYVQGSL